MIAWKPEQMSMRDAFGEKLLEIARADPRVYVLDGDLANSTKVNLVAEQLPGKFLQMGIAEQNMMGVAAGMAAGGLQPWAATFAAFLTKRSLDQIVVTIAQTRLDVKMIGAYSGLLNGRAGKTHQAIEDVAIMRSIPYMTVIAPGDNEELRQAMEFARHYRGPVYIRVARDPVLPIYREGMKFVPGKALILKEGRDISIITSGTQAGRALQAALELEKEGVSAEVLHVPTIKPLDVEAIVASARRTGAVVTAEEHSVIGGLGGAVAETLGEHYPVPVMRLGIEDQNIQSGSDNDLLERYGLSVEHVKRMAKKCLDKKIKDKESTGQ
jgi:transketolase